MEFMQNPPPSILGALYLCVIVALPFLWGFLSEHLDGLRGKKDSVGFQVGMVLGILDSVLIGMISNAFKFPIFFPGVLLGPLHLLVRSMKP